MKSKPLYNDGIYHVTSAVIATPVRFYPIANTTARIRRDPLWVALAFAALMVLALSTYADLLYPAEIVTMIGLSIVGLMVGWRVAILVLDSPGHQPATIISSSRKVTALYRAIRDARSEELYVPYTVAEADGHSDKD